MTDTICINCGNYLLQDGVHYSYLDIVDNLTEDDDFIVTCDECDQKHRIETDRNCNFYLVHED